MMKLNSNSRHRRAGFTLIELLVVIAIIGILAALILPALAAAKVSALKGKARTDINQIVTAIGGYESRYSRMPVSTLASQSLTANCPDFTYGTFNLVDRKGLPYTTIESAGNTGFQTNNSEIMSILMDLERFPIDNSPTVNLNHARNPQKHVFLQPKQPGNNTDAGVGTDLVFRDPWGNPYIITIDMNGDNKTRDGFYRLQQVSQSSGASGFNGLVNSTDAGGNGNTFEANTTVMVWSMGRYGKANAGVKANIGDNKEHLRSW